MTGTAETEAAELHEIYKLGVVPIPTNRDMVRKDKADLIYKTEEAKFIAVADDIAERYDKGQPVLIGTTSVERSSALKDAAQAAYPAQSSTRSITSRKPESSPRPVGSARSPWQPTWQAAGPTSCSAATLTSSSTAGCANAGWTR